MKRRRIISLAVIVAALVLMVFLLVKTTATDPLIRASSPNKTSAGSAFSVDVSIENNPGIAVFVIDLKYDETAFEFVSVENGGLFENELAVRDRDFDDYHAIRVMFAELDAFQGDGVLYTAKFIAKSDAPLGKYNFELGYTQGNIVESPENQLNPDIANTTVTIS